MLQHHAATEGNSAAEIVVLPEDRRQVTAGANGFAEPSALRQVAASELAASETAASGTAASETAASELATASTVARQAESVVRTEVQQEAVSAGFAAASSLGLTVGTCLGLQVEIDRPLLSHQHIAAQSTAPGRTALREHQFAGGQAQDGHQLVSFVGAD